MENSRYSQEHTDDIHSIVFHPNRPLMATRSEDQTVKLWKFEDDGSSLSCLNTLNIDSPHNNSMSFCANFNLLAIVCEYKLILWNYSNNTIQIIPTSRIFTMVSSVAFNPVLPIFAIGTYELGIKNSHISVKLWRIDSNEVAQTKEYFSLTGYTEKPDIIEFSPRNHLIFATSQKYFGNSVKLWKLRENGYAATHLLTLDKTVMSILFCRIAPIIGIITKEDSLLLYKFSPDYSNIDFFKEVTKSCNNFSFHPLVPILAIRKRNMIKLYNFSIDNLSIQKKTTLPTLSNNQYSQNIVVFCPTSNFLATDEGNKVKLWKIDIDRNGNLVYSSNLNRTLPLSNSQQILMRTPTQIRQNISTQNQHNSKINNKTSIRNSAKPLAIKEKDIRYLGRINVITIPSKFSKPEDNLCPNFIDLYYSFMKTVLPIKFIVEFEGQTGIDATGLSKIVFDKILKVYIDLFFQKIVNNNDYLIVKEDIDLRQLIADTKKLILLANVSTAKICLKIDPELLGLCKLKYKDLMDYFNNTKSNFKKFYNNTNSAIHVNTTYNELNNSTSETFLLNKNEINKKKLIEEYKKLKENSNSNKNMLNKLLKEIRVRRFAAKCGFKSWKQLENMCSFLEEIINYDPHWRGQKIIKGKVNNRNSFSGDFQLNIISSVILNRNLTTHSLLQFFDFEPKFDKASILSRVKCIMSSSRNDINIEKIPKELIELYPALKPFVDYIIGPNSTDENRKKFVQFITGSEYSTNDINIFLENTEISFSRSRFLLPFEPPSTCFSYIKLLKRPISGNYKNRLTEQRIDELILESILALTANI
jgi:hypothetical protein